MPAIRSQSVEIIDGDHATLTLVTAQFGTIFVDVLRTTGPTVITITSFQDELQQDQIVLENPPASQVEAQIDAAVQSLLPGGFQFRSHLVSNNPITVRIGCFDPGIAIPPDWWA